MNIHVEEHRISDIATLEQVYGQPSGPAIAKEIGYIHAHYRALIAASPFAVLATCGPDGMDASPRGDPAGFIAVDDEKTLLIPDRRGNNRIDSMRNILTNPHVALLFLIPGCGETLRVNGRAYISTAPKLLERFIMDDKLPRSVIVVEVDTVFFQCSKAIMRSKLWDASRHIDRKSLPSTGTILADVSNSRIVAEDYDNRAGAVEGDDVLIDSFAATALFRQAQIHQYGFQRRLLRLEKCARIGAAHVKVAPEIALHIAFPFIGFHQGSKDLLPVSDLVRRNTSRPYNAAPVAEYGIQTLFFPGWNLRQRAVQTMRRGYGNRAQFRRLQMGRDIEARSGYNVNMTSQ